MEPESKKDAKAAISKRFVESVEFILKENIDLKKQDIAEKLAISKQSFSEIMNLRQSPTLEVVQKLFTEFNVNPAYIFFGTKPIVGSIKTRKDEGIIPGVKGADAGNMILSEPKAPYRYDSNVTENVTPTVTPALKKLDFIPVNSQYAHVAGAGPAPVYNLGAPHVVTVNESGEENVIYVPVKARAGYLNGYGDPQFMASLPTYRMPGLANGSFRMFEVEGPSMAPNIQHGDRVIGQWVENLQDIAQNRVYVVVTKTGVIVKRLLNRIDQRGKIVVKSDTITHRHDYPTIEIDAEEILELWYCRLKLSSDFSEPAEIYHRIADLEADMVDVKRIINHFAPQLPPIDQKK